MFALEITFHEAGLTPETVLIRRPSALIGGQDYAHVVLDDMAALDYQLRLVRGVGRSFKCFPVGPGAEAVESRVGGTFQGSAIIDLGVVTLQLISLDSDCCLREGEPPDKASVRVLRSACRRPSPRVPAIVVKGAQPVTLSFHNDTQVLIGRSPECLLRFDSSDISSQHARLGVEGASFWIEDLGSTNGTFVDQQQVVGRQLVQAGDIVVLGREVAITPVQSEGQLDWILSGNQEEAAIGVVRVVARYPVLVSVSEVVRPSRIVLTPGTVVHLGREPTNDMWLGAPHISRSHATVVLSEYGIVKIADNSTNGIGLEGRIIGRGQVAEFHHRPVVLDFGASLTVGICFDEEQERRFLDAGGAVLAFMPSEENMERIQTNPNLLMDHGLQMRSVTAKGVSAESSLETKASGRRPHRSLVFLLLFWFCLGFMGVVVYQIASGPFK
jgi:pSer/pThr/pTyr-binding forkhead associated (FHA) protein